MWVARICHGTCHETQDGITVEFAKELRAQAARVPADGPPPVTLARQRAADAVEAATAALSADPTLAERQQRNLDLLIELLRRLTPLARQTAVELERQRLAMAGASTAHLGRTNPLAFEEIDAVSGRCPVIAARITTAVQPDWDTPRRVRELSASRLPGAHELAEIADRLRYAVASALDLPYPDHCKLCCSHTGGNSQPVGGWPGSTGSVMSRRPG